MARAAQKDYFKSPKDKDPIGFIPLENIEVRAAASGATFELHPQAGGTMKSVKTGDKSSAFEKGHHKAFVARQAAGAQPFGLAARRAGGQSELEARAEPGVCATCIV